ncbi:MAG TPA: 50S ribosomal protein L11 methyltransferase [Xanthomonadaceae bacterium]|nr:50S ribosomal protein L11 methyltransferase [Xanthomonadaceae bacterium]
MSGWLEASLDIEEAHRESIEQALESLGAEAIVLEDAGDVPILEPGPGETPLWPCIRLSALFAFDADRADILLGLLAAVPGVSAQQVAFREIAEQDWTRAWMDRYRPMRFGQRLWIYPGHITPPEGDDAVIVRLDPGLAFGTGTHPTTALCLEALDGMDLEGCDVLDFGCGSGILAIAALKLGARAATAVDNDPQALTASAANARTNTVAERLSLIAAEDFRAHGYDVVVANILAKPLIDLAPMLLACTRQGARLLLSGILAEQADAVAAAYAPHLGRIERSEREGWVRLGGWRR